MVNPNGFYTYAYLREDGTPYYIGKGCGMRIYSSTRTINKPKDKSRIIFLKQNLTEEEAFKHEIYMISVFGRKDLGSGILHNRTNGGDGTSGRLVSGETKRKIGESNKGKKVSQQTRKKIRNKLKGRTLSEETKRKISEIQKGKIAPCSFKGQKHTEESKRKIGESKTGKKRSEETRKKLSESNKGENNPRWGTPHTMESKRKISESHKGKKHTEETINKLKKQKSQKWECLETGFISNASGLTTYQNTRKIDVSKRKKLNMNLIQHLKNRNLDLNLHRPVLDFETNTATFYLYNLSSQLVGYQQYRPEGCKKVFNCAENGKYYTYRNKNYQTIAVWGVESLYLNSKVIFLTEGIFDAARMTNLGQSAIATLTNNPPKDYRNWLRMLNRPTVAVCDNDDAGRKLAKFGDYVEVVPEGKDLGDAPDDYVQYLLNKYAT